MPLVPVPRCEGPPALQGPGYDARLPPLGNVEATLLLAFRVEETLSQGRAGEDSREEPRAHRLAGGGRAVSPLPQVGWGVRVPPRTDEELLSAGDGLKTLPPVGTPGTEEVEEEARADPQCEGGAQWA